jgi:hypothetical protein
MGLYSPTPRFSARICRPVCGKNSPMAPISGKKKPTHQSVGLSQWCYSNGTDGQRTIGRP